MDDITLVDDRDARPGTADEQRVHRHDDRRIGVLHAELHLAVHAREDATVGVRHAQFGEHCPGHRIERAGVARDRRDDGLAAEFTDRQLGLGPGLHGRQLVLRNAHEHAQRVALRELVEPRRRAGAARRDEGPDLDVACRDGAGERGHHALQRLHAFQLPDLRLRCGVVGLARGERAVALVRFLGGHRVFLRECAIALGRRSRELEMRPRLRGRRAHLFEFAIEFGRVEFGEHLPGLHVIADVGSPALHVAGRARVDGGFLEGVDAGRQRDVGGILPALCRDEDHERQRRIAVRGRRDRGVRVSARQVAADEQCGTQQARDDEGCPVEGPRCARAGFFR